MAVVCNLGIEYFLDILKLLLLAVEEISLAIPLTAAHIVGIRCLVIVLVRSPLMVVPPFVEICHIAVLRVLVV